MSLLLLLDESQPRTIGRITTLSPMGIPGRMYSFTTKAAAAVQSGRMRVSFSVRQPGVTFATRQPGVTFATRQPSVTFTIEES